MAKTGETPTIGPSSYICSLCNGYVKVGNLFGDPPVTTYNCLKCNASLRVKNNEIELGIVNMEYECP